jgi:hypothetical protein
MALVAQKADAAFQNCADGCDLWIFFWAPLCLIGALTVDLVLYMGAVGFAYSFVFSALYHAYLRRGTWFCCGDFFIDLHGLALCDGWICTHCGRFDALCCFAALFYKEYIYTLRNTVP